MLPEFTFSKARGIKPFERDRSLDLNELEWPATTVPDGWEQQDGSLRRIIKRHKERVPVELEESILRFPSAPIHGLQRLHSHHVSLGMAETFHTFRVLRSSDASVQEEKVKRIFLMNTGLNERDKMGLYYTLAANLIQKDEHTVCIVRPFPGHLTRFPFQAFAETPLDRYLWDGSHLFRQFLRYMVETQWLLSVLARRSTYRFASGANLLAESEDAENSRLDADFLATEMQARWVELWEQSRLTLKKTSKRRRGAPKIDDKPPELGLFKASIVALRELLDLDDAYAGHGGDDDPDAVVDPALHVIGYSLGGFTAQSIFMSWPFLIGSCSTLLGGGALRQLAPSAFAHPEEWQTVLHSLRYELDDLMMSDDVGISEDSVAGVDIELFTFFKRTFYEVFQQDYQGSFQTRLAAFRKRMLFVVGGNDPIVRPESVLDSGPPGGINLLEIGGIGHFLDSRSEDPEEEKQRSFWIPEMSSLMSRFADGTAEDQAREKGVTSFDREMTHPAHSVDEFDHVFNLGKKVATEGPMGRLAAAELLAIGPDGALPSGTFERCLDDLLARVESTKEDDDGVLFMLRNEIPTLLLHDGLIRERATALYHDDPGIVRYCHGIERRRTLVENNIGKVCIVLPWNARSIMERMDRHPGYPSQAESAGGQVRHRTTPAEAWGACVDNCNKLTQRRGGSDSIRMFDGKQKLSARSLRKTVPEEMREVIDRNSSEGEELQRIAALPDCWVWVSRKLLNLQFKGTLTVDHAISALARIVPEFCPADEEELQVQDAALLEELRNERLRIITVSRARYNPRFRGRLVVTPRPARSTLVHVAMCLSLSKPVANKRLNSIFR